MAKGLAKCLPNAPVMEMKLLKRTHSQDEIESFKKDPLNRHEKLKAKFCYEILEFTKYYRDNYINQIETPFFVLQGKEDEYCDPNGAKLLSEKTVLVEDKEVEFIDGLYHDLLFEICSENTLDKIVDWINKRNPQSRRKQVKR